MRRTMGRTESRESKGGLGVEHGLRGRAESPIFYKVRRRRKARALVVVRTHRERTGA